ncbi:MAG: 50S ribosomal protein L11 methyltransferase [Dehalococcoidia bacterium]|nr:50S ribosomal protein L11 methyltransferase [Dehalococcoidia bacterium]
MSETTAPNGPVPADDLWTEVTVHVVPADIEAVADVLRAVAGSVAIEPQIRTLDSAEFAYGTLEEPATLRASLPGALTPPKRQAIRQQLGALALEQELSPLRFEAVADRQWGEDWKQEFGVMHVGRRIVIRPTWEEYERAVGELVITLDPGRAFGTGEHETTRLCLQALERVVRPGDAVVDVGTGSGILAIAAARLGASSVVAIDSDPEAVLVAQQNVELNSVECCVRTVEGSLGGDLLEPHSADIVVLNISSTALRELAGDVVKVLKPGGHFIGSGFIEETRADVQQQLLRSSLRRLGVESDGEWLAVVASAPAG